MAFAPIALTIPQYENYANWWMKAYEQGTTTPLNMATDSGGGTTLVKCEIDSAGFPITSGSARFIPFINGDYDLWLFPTEVEADADITVNAIQIADNLNADPQSTNTVVAGSYTVADKTAAVLLTPVSGKSLMIESSDGGLFKAVTGASPGTYSDNGGAYCGTVFIPTGGDGSSAWLRVGDVVSVKDFGATGDGVADDTAQIQKAIDAAGSGAVFFPAGDYRIGTAKNNEGVFTLGTSSEGLRVFGEGYSSRIFMDAAFAGAPSTALFHRPANGDNYGSLAAGANNLSFENLQLDGNRGGGATYASFSWGIDLDGGTGHIIKNVWSHGWEKGGLALFSFASEPDLEVQVSNVYCYNNNGTGGQGISISTLGIDSGRVQIDQAFCYGQSLGIDFSTGSATASNCRLWNNTAGGAKMAGSDDQKVVLTNCDLSDNTAASAQGFYTNGTFGLLIINGCRFERNNASGMQVAHAGTVIFNGAEFNGNGGEGVYISGGNPVIIMNGTNSRGNTNRGYLLASGYITANSAKASGNGRQGFHVTTTDSFMGSDLSSTDDCVTSDTVGINFQPSSSVSTYVLASATVLDTRGTPVLTIGVSLNSNVNEAKIGVIVSIGPTTAPLSDSGTDTVYFDRGDGWAKIATPGGRVGFYGTTPVGKRTVIGSRAGNAALASLLTALSDVGLLTDSSTA